jgi:hypothetical protein
MNTIFIGNYTYTETDSEIKFTKVGENEGFALYRNYDGSTPVGIFADLVEFGNLITNINKTREADL